MENETRDCPYCKEIWFKPIYWIYHISFYHGIGPRYTTGLWNLDTTWEEADAWYHASLLGIEPE